MARASWAVMVVACAVVALSGCSSSPGKASPSAPPAPPVTQRATQRATPTPAPTASGTPFSALAVGDCLTDPAGSAQIQQGTVTTIACTQPHSSEVYALPVLSGAAFPGDDTVTGAASDACANAFTGYVGVDSYSTSLNFSVYTPGQHDWDAGVRTAVCVVFSANGRLVGSVHGVGAGTPTTVP